MSKGPCQVTDELHVQLCTILKDLFAYTPQQLLELHREILLAFVAGDIPSEDYKFLCDMLWTAFGLLKANRREAAVVSGEVSEFEQTSIRFMGTSPDPDDEDWKS